MCPRDIQESLALKVVIARAVWIIAFPVLRQLTSNILKRRAFKLAPISSSSLIILGFMGLYGRYLNQKTNNHAFTIFFTYKHCHAPENATGYISAESSNNVCPIKDMGAILGQGPALQQRQCLLIQLVMLHTVKPLYSGHHRNCTKWTLQASVRCGVFHDLTTQ